MWLRPCSKRILRNSFPSRDHRFDEVLAIFTARENDADDVQGYKSKRRVSQYLMNFFKSFGTPEHIGCHKGAGYTQTRNHSQQRNDHRASGRVVAKGPWGVEADGLPKVGPNHTRTLHEVGKARMARANEPP